MKNKDYETYKEVQVLPMHNGKTLGSQRAISHMRKEWIPTSIFNTNRGAFFKDFFIPHYVMEEYT